MGRGLILPEYKSYKDMLLKDNGCVAFHKVFYNWYKLLITSGAFVHSDLSLESSSAERAPST